jgi:hypothetical protein
MFCSDLVEMECVRRAHCEGGMGRSPYGRPAVRRSTVVPLRHFDRWAALPLGTCHAIAMPVRPRCGAAGGVDADAVSSSDALPLYLTELTCGSRRPEPRARSYAAGRGGDQIPATPARLLLRCPVRSALRRS